MLNLLPPELHDKSWAAAVIFALCWLGRMMRHVRMAQRGRRKFFSVDLVFETILALCIFFPAKGLAAHFGFTGDLALGFIVVLSYLGPDFIETAAHRIFDTKGGKNLK